MLKQSLRLFITFGRQTIPTPHLRNYGLLVTRNMSAFCKTHKHESNEHKNNDNDKSKHKTCQESSQASKQEEEHQNTTKTQ